MTPKSEAWRSVESYATEVYNILDGKVAITVNFISDDTSHVKFIYAPSPENHSLSCRQQPVNISNEDIDISPRRANVCQHVVHQAETIDFVGLQNGPPHMTPTEATQMSRIDPTIKTKMEKNREIGVVCDNEHGCPFHPLWWDLMSNHTSTVWYRGQPIFCNGAAIGSFCCVSADGKPKNFDLRVKPFVEANVALIGLAMERQVLTMREQRLKLLARTKQIESGHPSFEVQAADESEPVQFDAEDLVNFAY